MMDEAPLVPPRETGGTARCSPWRRAVAVVPPQFVLLAAVIGLVSCASPGERPAAVDRSVQGDDRAGTLWYFGADDEGHHFVYRWRANRRYRLSQSVFSWGIGREFVGYRNGETVPA